MRRRLYFIMPDLPSARRMMDDLLLARIEERHIHFLARRGTAMDGLHEANHLQKSDLVHGAQVGLALGALLGVILGAVVVMTTATEDRWQIPIVLGSGLAGAIFGAWVASMVGSAVSAVRNNPYLAEGIDSKWLHMMFLATLPATAAVAALDPDRSPPCRFCVKGQDIYLHLPTGAGKTKITNAWIDSKLSTVSTIRNWNTVLKLMELTRG